MFLARSVSPSFLALILVSLGFHSHGGRSGEERLDWKESSKSGVKTFAEELSKWRPLRKLIHIRLVRGLRSDIQRDRLVAEMKNQGLVSTTIIVLVFDLLRVSILDHEGKECNSPFGLLVKGLPLSDMLFNIFLSPLDWEWNVLATPNPGGRSLFHWLRHGDQLLLGLPEKESDDTPDFPLRVQEVGYPEHHVEPTPHISEVRPPPARPKGQIP